MSSIEEPKIENLGKKAKCNICGKDEEILYFEFIKRSYHRDKEPSDLSYFSTFLCQDHFREFIAQYFTNFNKLIIEWNKKSEEFEKE